MRGIFLLLLLTVFLPLQAVAQSYSKYALSIGAPDPQPLCVITVLKLNGKDFTYGNPPKGRIHIDEVLQGNMQQKDLDVTWRSPRIPLCGNDEHPEESIKTWNATKILGFTPGSKQIASFSDTNGEDRTKQWPLFEWGKKCTIGL